MERTQSEGGAKDGRNQSLMDSTKPNISKHFKPKQTISDHFGPLGTTELDSTLKMYYFCSVNSPKIW